MIPSAAAGLPRARQVARRRAIVNESLSVLSGWGYAEAEVPLLLPFDELRSAVGDVVARQLYRFVDRDGEMLVLRGDLTPIIAWQLAPGITSCTLPLRVAYANRIARVQRAFAREQRESYVLGMELIGVPGPSGDLEVLTVAADVLLALGVEAFEIHIGHTGLVDAAIGAVTDDPARSAALLDAVSARDAVEVERLAARAPSAARARLRSFCDMDPSEDTLLALVDDPDPSIANAALELAALVQAFSALQLPVPVQLDLSARNDRGYYTGPRFRLLAPGGGEVLGGGGRYDRLFAHFGADVPASGFGLRVDRLVSLLGDPAQDIPKEPPFEMSAMVDPVAALRMALETRRAGGTVAIRHHAETLL